MSFKKNLIIIALVVGILLCCVGAVSASEDSTNTTLASDDVNDVVVANVEDDVVDEYNDVVLGSQEGIVNSGNDELKSVESIDYSNSSLKKSIVDEDVVGASEASIHIEDQTFNYRDDIVISFTVEDTTAIQVQVMQGTKAIKTYTTDKSSNFKLEGNTAVLNLTSIWDPDPGHYTLKVGIRSPPKTSGYNSAFKTVNFDIVGIDSNVNCSDQEFTHEDNIKINFTYSDAIGIKAKILSLMGNDVYEHSGLGYVYLANGEGYIEYDHLNSGIYLLELTTDTEGNYIPITKTFSLKVGNYESGVIYVDSNYDDEDQQGTIDKPYVVLQNAILNARFYNTTVFLKNGKYDSKKLTFPNIFNYTFIGESEEGVIINGIQNYPGVSGRYTALLNLNLDENQISFINLTFNDDDDSTSAIVSSGNGILNIINCTFTKVAITNQIMGGFVIGNTNSTIENCKILDSTTRATRGNGLIYYSNGHHIIKNTLIDNAQSNANFFNSVDITNGFIHTGKNAFVEVDNVTVSNAATRLGHGILHSEGVLLIKNSKFLNNKLGNYLFYINGGNLTVDSCYIENNSGVNYFIYENGVTSFTNITNSIIVNNDYKNFLNSVGTTSIDYNWWGTNEKLSDKINYWHVMDMDIAKDGDEIQITVDFNKCTNGTEEFTLKLTNDFDVTFKSSKGTLDTTVHTEDGVAKVSFISNGDYYVTINPGSEITVPISIIYVDGSFEGDELGTIDNPFKTISKAIDQTTGWETIYIKNGNYTESSAITLMNSLNIIGESEDGVIITGDSHGVFNNPSYMSKDIVLSFTNLTFANTQCSGSYAALSIGQSVSDLSITNCSFVNCSGIEGSLSIGSAKATIDNCNILDSKTTTGAGAIYFTGNGDYQIKDMIINNTSSNDLMQGVIVVNNNVKLVLNNFAVVSTSSSRNIIRTGANNSLTLTEGYIIDSDAESVIYISDDSDIVMDYVVISDNKATNIFNTQSNVNLTFTNGIIANNVCSGETINNQGENSNITLNYNIISGNGNEFINNVSAHNFDYNWWGTNDKPNDYADNWIIMEVDVSRSAGIATLDINFKHYTNGTDVSVLDKLLEYEFRVQVESSTGDFNATDFTKDSAISFNFAVGENEYVDVTSDIAKVTEYFTTKTIYVDANFIGNGTGTEDNPFATLQEAIDNADDGDSIIVKEGNYTEKITWTGGKGINILGENENVNINLISGSSISVNAMDLYLQNLNFNASGSDIRFTINQGNLNVINCVFDGVSSSQPIMSLLDSNAIILESGFTNIQAKGNALFYNSNSNLTVESSILSNINCNNYLVYNVGDDSNSAINYNAIYDNTYAKGIVYGSNVNLDYNWWNSNTPTYEEANTWIILDADYTSKDAVSGENVTVVATLNHYITKDAEIGEAAHYVPVEGMEVTFTLDDGTVLSQTIENGEANFTYTINQSENVLVKSGNAEITVPITLKTVRIDLEDNYTATEDANITINAPGIHANMTLIIDGNSETVEVNNTYVKTIENVKAGSHSVFVIYNDGSSLKYDVKSFTADKLQSQISLDNVTINVGESVPVEFSPANDATGRVFIDINGKKIFKVLEDGKVSIVLEDFAIGTYDVSVYYEGDGKYLASEDTFTITVNGFNANLKANASDIKVGENAVIDIEINENATGATNVILGDLIIPVIFIDGKATVSIPDLANGTYTATVKFAGDSIFLAAETTVTFTVSKEELPSDINITIDIPEGTTAPEFTVNLPSDATGDFNVTIDNQTYSQPLVNGSATVKVPEQTPGNHTISTAYSGDGKYDGFTSPNSTFNVPKASIPGGENAINMTTPSDSATPSYSIKLPADAKGNLTVTVDGKDTYSKELVNGSATVTVPELPAGKHNITVTYSGDAKYSSISKNTTVNVPEKAKPAPAKTTKVATKITAKNKKFKASKKVKKYTITLKSGKKPVNKVQVTLKIKGKTYKAKTNAKGKATFKIKKLTKKGKYSAVIKFAGNKNYKATSKKVKITVKK